MSKAKNDLRAPRVEFDLSGYSQRLIDHLWGIFLEEHLKPSWITRQKEIERHVAEKGRLMAQIDVLQEALKLHGVVSEDD